MAEQVERMAVPCDLVGADGQADHADAGGRDAAVPGDPSVYSGGQARAQAELSAHVVPWEPRSPLKV